MNRVALGELGPYTRPPLTVSYVTPGAASSALIPLDSNQGRAFYAGRIALFHKTVGLLSAGFLVLLNLIIVLHLGYAFRTVFNAENAFHLASVLVSLGVWLGLRHRVPPARALPGIDVVSTVAAMTAYLLMALFASSPPERLDVVMMLIATILQTTRAIIVPSTARQTLFIGIGISLGLMGMTYDLYRRIPYPPEAPGVFFPVVYIVLWCIVTVTVTTLASRVIYGLRQQVEEAQRLGQYTLDEKIGEGGMGVVFRARHALLRRPTAIKLLPPGRGGAGTLSRFEREVQLTSRLTHPNTVAIYDYGHTPDGVFYYAMEYLEGVDLEKLVEADGPQDPSRVVHVLRQVCGALAEAHGIGLVHRDIKPANIILCERGGIPDTAKIVDFGLVKQLAPDVTDPEQSSVNTLMGTPLYLSPEAIKSPEAVDARSDLYALGAVAYYLLTGRTVFEGQTLVEICGQHLHTRPVPPSERAGRSLPSDLEALVLRCLEKNPADRPESAAQLKRALERCNVPLWTEEQARSSWARVEHRATDAQSGSGIRKTVLDASLTVDMRDRVSVVRESAS